jgi:hypothetical protein
MSAISQNKNATCALLESETLHSIFELQLHNKIQVKHIVAVCNLYTYVMLEETRDLEEAF